MKFIDTNQWIPVHTLPGFECCIEYYVNEQGDVKSTKGGIERLLKHRIKKSGYPEVNLTQRIGRKTAVSVNVAKLVALAFLPTPPTPPGRNKGNCYIRHLDGNRANCSVSNLKWMKRNS